MNNRFVEIRKQIGKFIANFSVTEENGTTYIYDGDVIREGLDISTYDDEGNVIPLPDGEYVVKGVAIVVADGKVMELPETNSLVNDTTEPESKAESTPKTENNNNDRVSELEAENEKLRTENEALKAELDALKNTPMGKPVPQRTDMASMEDKDVPESVKGTKYERSYKIFKA